MGNLSVVRELEPERVFKYFADISNIPRCSGDEDRVCEYLLDFASKNGLEGIKEDSGNIIIKKDATLGYENAPGVILQGHVDMICTKTETSSHDFTKDPIQLVVDGDLIRAKDTTLGADNGIAVAMALAILESSTIAHPAIEALFTVDEESGMFGAENLDGSIFKGKVLINIDSEEEGIVLSSCAGGVRALINLPIYWTMPTEDFAAYKITIKGLQGGHSGAEIHKIRGNAIKNLGRLLEKIDDGLGNGFEIFKLDGGEKMNAIAKFVDAFIMVDKSKENQMMDIIGMVNSEFSNEFALSEPDYKLEVHKIDSIDDSIRVFDKVTKKATISILRLIPNGVQTMSPGVQGLVESSNNIGELRTSDSYVVFNSAVRSSVKSLKNEITDRMEILSRLTGAGLELVADYPEWQYKGDSRIRQLMNETWKEIYGVDLKVDAIHAGLECGFLKEKIGDIDMVSLGPDIRDAHTPLENMSISSTQRIYSFLIKVLENMNRY